MKPHKELNMGEEIAKMLKAKMSEKMYNEVVESKADKYDNLEDYLRIITWLLLKSDMKIIVEESEQMKNKIIIEARIIKGGEIWMGENLKIKLEDDGYKTKIYMNGKKLDGVQRLVLDIKANEKTKITMEMRPVVHHKKENK